MNDCTEFRQAILEADLSELRAEHDSPLGAHLRSCADCRASADAVIRGYAALDKGLDAVAATRHTIRSIREHRRKWLSMPLAAAAVLALLMMPRSDSNALPPMEGITKLLFPEEAVVIPSVGQSAVVIHKPEMMIVWLYNEEIR